jgi:hypothetical protein
MAADVGIRASRIQNHASGVTRAERIIQDRPAVVPDRLGRFASRLLRTDHDPLARCTSRSIIGELRKNRGKLAWDHRAPAPGLRGFAQMRRSRGLRHTTFRSRISSTRQHGNVSLTVSDALRVHSRNWPPRTVDTFSPA